MKVLVTGATGFLGRSVVQALLKHHHEVRAFVRPGTMDAPFGTDSHVELYRGDLRAAADLLPAFDGVDVLIHLAAVVSGSDDAQLAGTLVGTERLLDAMSRSQTNRLVLASTLSVYDWRAPWFSLTEATPLQSGPLLYRRDGYAISKVWQEKIVRRQAAKAGWQLTVLRPGFIWGPGNEWCIGAGIDLGRLRVINGPFRRLPLTYVTNCANAFAAAAESSMQQETILNVLDSDVVRAWRFARDYQKTDMVRRTLIPVPYHLVLGLACCAAIVARLLFGPRYRLPAVLNPLRHRAMFCGLRFPNERIQEQLGWRPALDYEQSLQHMRSAQPRNGLQRELSAELQ